MKIFPKEFLEHSKEYYLKRISIRSQIIYLAFLLVIIVVIVSLPFINVDTFTQARGIVKTGTEQTVLYAPISAPIQRINIVENVSVQQGDTLIVFVNEHIRSEITAKKYNLDTYKVYANDLRLIIGMVGTKSNKLSKLKSELISKEYVVFQEKVKEALFNVNINEKKYNRYRELLENDFVSDEEFESIKYIYDSAKSKYEQLINSYASGWQTRLRQYEQDVKRLNAELSNLEQLNDKYFIISPIDGTVQEFQGLQVGSFVMQNQLIAKISPEAELIAEVWVTPQYVGIISENQFVNFHIDAFNYREWGKIKGKVNEISNDAIIIDNRPYFKVRCSLDQKFLTLKSGYQGNLKKGMTLTANFLLRKRSLYNLLFDKIDDWLNPATNIANEVN